MRLAAFVCLAVLSFLLPHVDDMCFVFHLKTHRRFVFFVITGRTASTWISEIESSSYFGSGEVDDSLSAVQLGYSGNKGPRLFLLDS